MTWLEALKSLDAETTQEAEIPTAASSVTAELSESLTQRGAKGARSTSFPLLALVAPPHIRNPESGSLRQRCPGKAIATPERPWLIALRSLEESISREVEGRASRVLPPSGKELSEAPVQQGDKSAKSPAPSPDG